MKRAAIDPGRISALSDGVFAIAVTLLVLDLQLHDVGSSLSDPSEMTILFRRGGNSCKL